MKHMNSYLFGVLIAMGAISQTHSQTTNTPSAAEVSAFKDMMNHGFLNSVSASVTEQLELTSEQLTNLELGLADIQSTLPAMGTVTETEMLTAMIAAHMAVEALLAEILTPEQLATLKLELSVEDLEEELAEAEEKAAEELAEAEEKAAEEAAEAAEKAAEAEAKAAEEAAEAAEKAAEELAEAEEKAAEELAEAEEKAAEELAEAEEKAAEEAAEAAEKAAEAEAKAAEEAAEAAEKAAEELAEAAEKAAEEAAEAAEKAAEAE